MFTADQLVAHLVGDYIIQSDWMATNKTKNNAAAAIHAITYSLPFWLIAHSAITIFIIVFTHFLIDRYRLARFVVFVKNGAKDRYLTPTGYPDTCPAWLSTWLLIIADNTIHILINGVAIYFH
jgi:hypothetical protein